MPSSWPMISSTAILPPRIAIGAALIEAREIFPVLAVEQDYRFIGG